MYGCLNSTGLQAAFIVQEFFSHPFVQPGSLPTSFSEDAPDFSPLAPTRSLAMHTIASSLALGSTSGTSVQVPYVKMLAQCWCVSRALL